MGDRLITPPAAEPISLAEAKAQLGVSGTADDTLITALIKQSREYLEKSLNRVFITQTWDVYADRFPCLYPSAIRLTKNPVQSVTAAYYVDANGDEQLLDPADYVLDDVSQPARLFPATAPWGFVTLADRPNAVRVRIVAGYGSAGTDVPEPIRQAIRLHLGDTWAALSTSSSAGEIRSETIEGVGRIDYQTSGTTTTSAGTKSAAAIKALTDLYRLY